MAKKPLPDAELLRQLLEYDPETGFLTWRPRTPDMSSGGGFASEAVIKRWNSRFAGKQAFTSTNHLGYKSARINNVSYMAHRIIWKMINGEDPRVIDHIDGDPGNNCLSNLRNVTQRENLGNCRVRSDNTSGHSGIGYLEALPETPWRARIRRHHLGCFASKEEAIEARRTAEEKLGFLTRKQV